MDFIVDFFVEFFMEIVVEGFVSAGTEVAPYEKLSEKKKDAITVVAVIVSVLLFLLLVIGGIMLLETKGESDLGKVLIGFPIVYFLTGIILKIVRFVKKERVGK